MVDAIISPLLEQLISMVVQEASERVRLVTGVEGEVKKLTSNLRAIQAVLVDAEQRQMNEETVRLWLHHLKYASYDMEDVLDEWNTARLKLQIEGVDHDESALVPKKVCSFFPAPCFGFKQVFLRCDIALKIKEINQNLDEITKQKEMFNFNVNLTTSFEKPKRIAATSLIDESEISGRAVEKNTLISRLVSESSSREQKGLQIISLLGMGGVGKTTLAQLAYNNDEVKRSFDIRMWVCVSDPFDEIRIARAIIEALENKPCKLVEFQSLLTNIQKIIEGKKFLLVLDDMWNEDYSKWEPFYHCLKNDSHCSKILITTRKETVAHIMKSADIISIKQLAEEECWLLFRRIAFFGRSKEEYDKLEEVGRKIVSKCNGLPLAAKTIGSLLRFKKTEEEWQRILYSDMWKVEELNKGLLAPLLLSYNDLPSAVKPCFLYCAVFPKDYLMKKNELIRLWMSQGYLSVAQGEEMENLGEEYFHILATRSFFQEFLKFRDNIVCCKMHDIIHDFAQFMCKKECSTIEINDCDDPLVDSFEEKTCLHAMLTIREMNLFPISIYKAKKLRSLVINHRNKENPSFINVLPKIFDELTSLRAVVITCQMFEDCGVFMNEIPRGIGKLIHLRYLNLSNQLIEELPEVLCELYNLQLLDVSRCLNLKELPQGIGKLINLTHFINPYTGLQYMPIGITRLTSLRILKKFAIGVSVNGRQICNLESLKHLKLLEECGIHGLGNVSDVGEAKRLELHKSFKNLRVLGFCFDQLDEQGWSKKEDHEELLEALQPPPNLKELEISNYKGNTVWPSWMISLNNLRDLSLKTCINCKHLPPLGKLPSLEEVVIRWMPSLKRVGNEILGTGSGHGSSSSSSLSAIAFPKLKKFSISWLRGLEEWDFEITGNIEIMPCLHYLDITTCSQLKSVPDHILQKTTLRSLRIIGCNILRERYRKEAEQDWAKISHIPEIRIH
ncbi:Disease resistance protein [Melia azedarach]|uniref:Disease resistance protein n=1 Tax=Melia azedarach TaxID=155640 RepID=A0ACC1Y5T1_MELAZ|nr:Disease resistance protein [Melia azedarach]